MLSITWNMLQPEASAAVFTAADKCLGEALSALGVSRFLTLLPLNLHLPESSGVRREWLLPVVRQHLKRGDIAFFASHIVPELVRAREQMNAAGASASAGTGPGALYRKLWSLLPPFLAHALDVTVRYLPNPVHYHYGRTNTHTNRLSNRINSRSRTSS